MRAMVSQAPKTSWRGGCSADCAELMGAQSPILPGQAAPAQEPYNLVVPRSKCPGCGRGINAIENIPVFSWLALRVAKSLDDALNAFRESFLA